MEKFLNKVGGYIKLLRIKDYFVTNILFGFLGIAVAQKIVPGIVPGFELIMIMTATFVVTAFAFAFNDVEDAPEDAQDPAKVNRNPVSAGLLTTREGYYLSGVIVGISVILLWGVALYSGNMYSFVVGVLLLLSGFFYSWRKVRVKSIPVADILIHGFMLASGQLLLVFFAYTGDISFNQIVSSPFVWGIFIAVNLFSYYGQLQNHLRDFEVDKNTGMKTSTVLMGKRSARILQISFMITGIVISIVVGVAYKISLIWILQTIGMILTCTLAVSVKFVLTHDKTQSINLLNSLMAYAITLAMVCYIYGIYPK